MRTFIHRLSFAWLILAIVSAPLQALALPMAEDSTPDCEMHAGDQTAGQDETAPHCPACVDHECDGAGCAGHNCSATHLQLSLVNAVITSADSITGIPLPPGDHTLTSLTLSPLDRPPAV